MKTTIVIEGGRVTIQIDEADPVLVQSTMPAKPVTGLVEHTSPPTPQGSDTPSGLVPEKPAEISPPTGRVIKMTPKPSKPEHKKPESSTDLSNTLPTEPAAKDIDVPTKPKRFCVNCGDDVSHMHVLTKYCKKPECKKAQSKAGNDAYRIKKGHTPGAPRKPREQKNQDVWGNDHENTVAPLSKDAPPAKTTTRSKCCEGKVEYYRDADTDQRLARCLACMNDCQTYEYTPPFEDTWNCGACRTVGRLCRMHFKLEEDGKKPPQYRNVA